MIIGIACMAKNKVIGKRNKLPWYLSNDIKSFRLKTLEKIVIMGGNTYRSLGCKFLPNRYNFVLTNDKSIKYEKNEHGYGVVPFSNPMKLLNTAMKLSFKKHKDTYIIGGAEIYKLYMDYMDLLDLTCIEVNIEGDTYFPDLNNYPMFNLIGSRICENEKYPITVRVYKNNNVKLLECDKHIKEKAMNNELIKDIFKEFNGQVEIETRYAYN